MIKVLFLETELRLGGTEKVISNLLERIDRTRFEPLLCCVYRPGVLSGQITRKGVRLVHSLAKSRWDPRLPFRLFLLMRREKVGAIFIVSQPLIQFWGALCGLLAGVPVRVAAVRTSGAVNRERRRRWVGRLTVAWLTRFTALSEWHRAYLAEDYRIPSKKIEVIPNGVDIPMFQGKKNGDDSEPLGDNFPEIPAGAPVVGIVAMCREGKNVSLFVRAARKVLDDIPTTYFLVTGDGPERPMAEQLSRTLGLEKRVLFLGARQDVPSVVRRMDVCVLSSDREGLPNAVLEYMAAGKPVVATHVGCLPEIMVYGKTGFLVPPGDWRRLGSRVTFLLRHPELAKRMGQEGLDRVQERYTIQRMVSETERLFEQLHSEEEQVPARPGLGRTLALSGVQGGQDA